MFNKNHWVAFCFCVISAVAQGQQSFDDFMAYGAYSVGFCDTLLYNPAQAYAQYGYAGDAPLFVQIWHPIAPAQAGERLAYKAFRTRAVPKQLEVVYDTLCLQMDHSFIAYNIAQDFVTYQPIDYHPHTAQDVLHAIGNYVTKSSRAPLPPKSDFPVILYHHGAQGLSDENFAMAEYFASRGYIFISANYHLPFEKLPYAATTGSMDFESFPKRVTELTRQLSSNPTLFFIGHSWGAQNGFGYLHEKGWATAFVSLETTIEFKTDTGQIKEMWGSIYKRIATQKTTYPLPILMIANTREDKPFDFFKSIGTNKLYFASAKAEFGHESYTSAYHMRHLLHQQFPQPDAAELQTQLALYVEHLGLIEAFLTAVQQNEDWELKPWRSSFYINE